MRRKSHERKHDTLNLHITSECLATLRSFDNLFRRTDFLSYKIIIDDSSVSSIILLSSASTSPLLNHNNNSSSSSSNNNNNSHDDNNNNINIDINNTASSLPFCVHIQKKKINSSSDNKVDISQPTSHIVNYTSGSTEDLTHLHRPTIHPLHNTPHIILNTTTHRQICQSVEQLAVEPRQMRTMRIKKSTINTQPARKRAALGDVSNVAKGGDAAEAKKPAAKGGLVSKASQPTGVTKNSTRSALGAKDANKKSLSKAAGSGVMKRKTTAAAAAAAASIATSVKEETPVEDEQPSRKKVHIEPEKKTEVVEEKENEVEAEAEVIIDPEPKESVRVEFAEGVRDLDAEDLDDPLMVAEYVVEIFEYLKKLEVATKPNEKYMAHQEDLEWKMRGILVDWLIEVHTRFHLLPETLFLAVNIIDRFLSTKVVQLDRLQLVGVTAMFIASKYEEVLSPHVANFRHVADDGFTEAEILSAERYVLSALNYDLSYPNPMNFLRRISKADDYDIQTRTLGKYLMEISLLDHRFMKYLPSHVAAASMYLARLILEKGEWDPMLTHYSGYSEDEIEPVFQLMVDYLARPVTHEAFFKKYASKKFLKASILTRQWAKKHASLYGIDITQPLESS
ncbi:hypothetical protein EYC84_010196 [Monilinia fructicola]|uniref:Uncharacterized protein n=1 Tax=Monilinia fructicola TaxID=38448 RepID=A0A5M9JCY3_MONFR|nr:hypothetical protein EYC84_010196 [Monilinia fructicola]